MDSNKLPELKYQLINKNNNNNILKYQLIGGAGENVHTKITEYLKYEYSKKPKDTNLIILTGLKSLIFKFGKIGDTNLTTTLQRYPDIFLVLKFNNILDKNGILIYNDYIKSRIAHTLKHYIVPISDELSDELLDDDLKKTLRKSNRDIKIILDVDKNDQNYQREILEASKRLYDMSKDINKLTTFFNTQYTPFIEELYKGYNSKLDFEKIKRVVNHDTFSEYIFEIYTKNQRSEPLAAQAAAAPAVAAAEARAAAAEARAAAAAEARAAAAAEAKDHTWECPECDFNEDKKSIQCTICYEMNPDEIHELKKEGYTLEQIQRAIQKTDKTVKEVRKYLLSQKAVEEVGLAPESEDIKNLKIMGHSVGEANEIVQFMEMVNKSQLLDRNYQITLALASESFKKGFTDNNGRVAWLTSNSNTDLDDITVDWNKQLQLQLQLQAPVIPTAQAALTELEEKIYESGLSWDIPVTPQQAKNAAKRNSYVPAALEWIRANHELSIEVD